jgi:hypothetical protein
LVSKTFEASYQVTYVLAYILGLRFSKTSSNEDCEEATALLERVLEPGGCPDSFRVVASTLSLSLTEVKSVLFWQKTGILEGFLRAPSFDTLCSAASRGPVIIINDCKWRSDIVIMFYKSMFHSYPQTFFAHATNLRDEPVKARKRGLDSVEYQDVLCYVFKGLYELVGEPVIKRLRVLGVPEQSRIWWCPTTVFCSLPLHAMGPIPSRMPGKPQYSRIFTSLHIRHPSLPLSSLERQARRHY